MVGTTAMMTERTMHTINKESDALRAKLKAKGLPGAEVSNRVKQSREDKIALMKADPGYGKTLKPSMKSETFRPNFQGKMDNAKQRANPRNQGKLRAEFVAFAAKEARESRQRSQRVQVQKTLEKAFHEHPKEAEAIRKNALKLSKTPEERERKKQKKRERREMARAMTGVEEGSWWDPLVKAGADLLPKLLPMLIGMGDYEEEEPPITKGEMPQSNSLLAAATNGQAGTQVPYMHKKGDKVRVQHREYIGDVYSTTSSFSLTSFPINPGMEELFPWLAPIAACFTYYRLMGAVCDIVSQGTDYANVAGLGYYGLATQYNPLLPDFANKKEFMNYEFANACKPSCNLTHWIECKPNDLPDPERTVRSGTIPSNADLRLYDHGKLFLAVGGNPSSGGIVGMLWMTYDVEFYLPKVSGSASGVLDYYAVSRTDVTAANPLGNTLIAVDPRSTMNWTVTNNVITIPGGTIGDYYMSIVWRGTASPGNVAPGLTVSTGLTAAGSGGFALTGELCFYNTYALTVDGTQSSYTFTYDSAGTCLPLGNLAAGKVSINVSEIPRAPPAACPIFDPAGLEYEDRYDAYMMKILSPVEQAHFRSHASRKTDLDNSAVVARFEKRKGDRDAFDGQRECEKLRNDAFSRMMAHNTPVWYNMKEDRVRGLYYSMHNGQIFCDRNGMFNGTGVWRVKSLEKYSDNERDEMPLSEWAFFALGCEPKDLVAESEKRQLEFLSKKYALLGDDRTSTSSSTGVKTPGSEIKDHTLVDVGVARGCDSTSSEEEVPGMDPYTVLRRVGNYGYMSCSDGHFVVRTFESDKMKWWFLDEENGFERVFMETYAELLGNEFMTCIDSIIEKKINPESDSLKTTSARKMLFRKRGSKDYSSFNPSSGSA